MTDEELKNLHELILALQKAEKNQEKMTELQKQDNTLKMGNIIY